ncbi:MAG: PDDEXK nuclease domain-containing protein [Oscillospiraceae bacterium]|jgi:predicted nuclease of restriction endonuclease-like (RecB) superfamily/site-specific recombinase XerD|nr:PDDEXK nuclease domain-containing protein [Oscillospiraceae bacterium]
MGTKKPKNTELAVTETATIDETALFERVSAIIENRKYRAQAAANSEATLMFWEIGHHVNSVILDNKRAAYGKQIVATLSLQLEEKYGSSYEVKNLRRMLQFAERFSDFEIVVPLARQLSWSHFIALLPLKSDDAFMFYANDAMARNLGKRELRKQISRKAYERREIANANLSKTSNVPFNMFKDPYLLDMFDLKDSYHEADLRKAIVGDIKQFILEFGHGFAFIDEEVRMTMDGDDFRLDLLFYNRELKRLVAVELKLGKFKPIYKGQMEYMLADLDRFLVKQEFKTKELTESILLKWFQAMDVTPRTKQRKVSATRMFIKYLSSLGIEAFVPEFPKSSDYYVPYIFSDDEFARIIAVADNWGRKRSGFKYRIAQQMPLLLRILYGCGLRLQEALSLQWSDVNFNQGTLFIKHAKYDKQRIIPMSNTLTKIFELYRYSGLCAPGDYDYLFSKNGSDPASKSRVEHIFIVILKDAGIEYFKAKEKERGPCLHCLRHLFAFHSFSQAESMGIPFNDSVPYLSTYLGHSNILGTDKYLNFSHEMYTDAHDAINNYTKGVFPKAVTE